MFASGKEPAENFLLTQSKQEDYYPFLDYPNNYPFYYLFPPPFFGYPPPPPFEPSTVVALPKIVKVQEQVHEPLPKKEAEPLVFQKKAKGGMETDSNSDGKTSKEGRARRMGKCYQQEWKTRGQVKLDFRIEWKNENRNIVPNLINQMISFLLKKIKSYKIVKRIFEHIPHDPRWTEKKFYLYMKKIKESVTHYVNENVLTRFLEIHQPKCELYDYDQQLFYMKVSRVAILHFLQDDAVLISLTSNRMSQAKRDIHLIARDALLRKLIELCRRAKQ